MSPRGPGTTRERLDVLLVERGLAPSRVKARALILAGQVLTAGKRLDKPGQRLAREIPLEVRAGRRYVSRGALKLEGALTAFGIRPDGRDALDVGASTGGFTQVLLEAGARRVVALDVGRGQLDWSLRRDPRVYVLEGVNARYLEAGRLPFPPTIAVVDVSFISLKLVLPPLGEVLASPGEIMALIKPQFEVGRGQVGRGGIVRDPARHAEVLEKIAALASAQGLGLRGLCPAAIRGAEGNQEFCMHLVPGATGLTPSDLRRRIQQIVADEELS